MTPSFGFSYFSGGAFPVNGPGGPWSFDKQASLMPSDDQEVTKAFTSIRAAGTQTMPPMMEATQDDETRHAYSRPS